MTLPTEKQIDVLVDRGMEMGLNNLSQEELLNRLGNELDALKSSEQVYSDPWYAPDRGIATNALKFLQWQEHAFRNELCDTNGGCLKEQYRKVLQSEGTAGQIKAVANALIAALAPQYAIPSLVVTIAMWLIKVQLDAWCSQGFSATSSTL